MSNRVCPTCFIEVPANGVCDDHGVAIVKTAVKLPTKAPASAPVLVVTAPAPTSDGRMSMPEIFAWARAEMDKYGLTATRLVWSQAKGFIGRCRCLGPIPIEIQLSRPFFEVLSDTERKNTILHEIAHALTPGHGHDSVWRRKCLEIGGNGQTRSHTESRPKGKYTGTCPNGHTAERQQKSAKMYTMSCSKCAPYYDPRFVFKWVQNH